MRELLQFFLLQQMFLKKVVIQEFIRKQPQEVPHLHKNILIFSNVNLKS